MPPRGAAKTKELAAKLKALGWNSALIVDRAVDEGFLRASRNIHGLDVLPTIGANVYDILHHDVLAITTAGVEGLKAAPGMEGGKRAPTKPLSREAMYKIIRAPLITEKATLLSEKNQVVFRVAHRRDQAGDQGGGRRPVRRQGDGVNTLVQKGKTKRFKGRPGVRSDVKKAYRDAGRGPVDRLHHRAGVRRRRMALKTIQPGHGQPARHGADRPLRAVEGQAGQGADRGQEPSRGGRNNHGRITSRFRGGGHKQSLPHGRLQAPQVRRAGDGRAAGIRSEPHRVHRADQVCRTASWPISWRRSA